jgi:hypothetical protein
VVEELEALFVRAGGSIGDGEAHGAEAEGRDLGSILS